MFRNDTMKNIKRTVRRFGMLLGHRKGVEGERCDRVAAVSRSRHAATHSPSVLFLHEKIVWHTHTRPDPTCSPIAKASSPVRAEKNER